MEALHFLPKKIGKSQRQKELVNLCLRLQKRKRFTKQKKHVMEEALFTKMLIKTKFFLKVLLLNSFIVEMETAELWK